jgi:hypothetical protein
MADPGFLQVSIEGSKGPIYLPSGWVRAEQEKLIKARRQAAGRLFSDYKQSYDMQPGMEQPPEALSFDLLRDLADTSPIDRLAIDTRIYQIKRVARRAMGRDGVGFAVRHIRDADPDYEVPDGLQKLCRQIEDLIAAPSAPFHTTMRDFLASAVEEELTIDRKAMVLTRDRRGRPIRFHLIDGSTVRPVPVIIFQEMQKQYLNSENTRILSYEETAHRLSERHGLDLTKAAYVQIVDNAVTGAWQAHEMSVDITNPTVRLNWWGYGRSVLARSWGLSDAFLKAWRYNLELFKLNYPEAVLMIRGEYDEEGLAAFRRKILGEGDGTDNNWRLPILPTDGENDNIQMAKLRDSPKEMMFEQFLQSLVRLKCAAYRMHPSLINFTTESGTGSIVFNAPDQEREIALSQEEGFNSLLASIGDWLTRELVQPHHPDLCLVWEGLDRQSDEQRMQLIQQKVNSIYTINEVRQAEGLDPIEGIPEQPGDFIGNFQQAVQIAAGQQQAAEQGPEGMPGANGAGPGGDDDNDQESPAAPAWWQQMQQQQQGADDDDDDRAPLRRSRGAPVRYVRIRIDE